MKSIDKHRKIIRAAIKVFAKKGFFNARISDIAKEAKVADGTIYLYFKNKFDILISVFDQEVGKLTSQIIPLLKDVHDPKLKLKIFISKHLEEMKKNRHLAEVIHIELRQTNKLIREYRKNEFNKYLAIAGEIIREGQEQNVFRKDIDTELIQQILFGSLDEVSRVWGPSNPTDKEFSIELVTEQISNLFQHGALEKQKDAVLVAESP